MKEQRKTSLFRLRSEALRYRFVPRTSGCYNWSKGSNWRDLLEILAPDSDDLALRGRSIRARPGAHRRHQGTARPLGQAPHLQRGAGHKRESVRATWSRRARPLGVKVSAVRVFDRTTGSVPH